MGSREVGRFKTKICKGWMAGWMHAPARASQFKSIDRVCGLHVCIMALGSVPPTAVFVEVWLLVLLKLLILLTLLAGSAQGVWEHLQARQPQRGLPPLDDLPAGPGGRDGGRPARADVLGLLRGIGSAQATRREPTSTDPPPLSTESFWWKGGPRESELAAVGRLARPALGLQPLPAHAADH